MRCDRLVAVLGTVLALGLGAPAEAQQDEGIGA